ncbi:hypothetical protein F5883DRAFT_647726 [Diaporthe sp. PMI_573]|nr:hypothetical protein F5883DRAFT_647726 [Diaporthaceae sp. PMI_573]
MPRDERFFIAGKDLLNASTPVPFTQVANYNSPYDGSSTQISQCGPSPDYCTPSHSVPSAGSPGVFRSPAPSAPKQSDFAQESPHGSYDTIHERPAKRRAQYAKSNYPLDDVQEACLLRYFVEVISPWFDHCDNLRHFQTVVPTRARHCEPLLNAILAAAARHLVRVPQYRTEPGGIIEYLGQPLPNLTAHTAFEYMLRCIPALHDVPQIQDEEYRENLAAAAVILRQFEEMDHDQETAGEKDAGRVAAPGDAVSSTHLDTRESSQSSDHGVNFLDIAKAILRTTTTSGSNGLTDAVGWLALRQEIYYAFSLGRSPQISLPREQEREASPVNRLILHTYQVAKWNYGDKTVQEWERLKAQEDALQTECCSHFIPVLKREADRSRGEVFPLIWYASDGEVTATQHFILARTVLIAENPSLKHSPDRGLSRGAEHQVRSHVLQLCGLAMHHLGSAPNLVTAALGIMLYGDYFQDPWERAALLRVLDEWKSKYAWPVRKAYQIMGVQVPL